MSGRRRNHRITKERESTKNSEQSKEERKMPNFAQKKQEWLISTFMMLILSIGGWMAVQIYDLNGQIAANSAMMLDMKQEISDIAAGLNGERGVYARLAAVEKHLDGMEQRLNSVEQRMDGLATDVSGIKEVVNISAIMASTNIKASVDTLSVEPNDRNISYNAFSASTSIGTDSDGNKYVAKDLVGDRILLTYIEDDEEVYFLGQYNEKYHWDGYCVTNTYNLSGELTGICESNFNDGQRIDYKSFCKSHTDSSKWTYSNKSCNEANNSGINISYSFSYNKTKIFTPTNARVTDLVFTDKFIVDNDPRMISYYSGNTADGKYNDTTGKAYEVIYDEDGSVKTLYIGGFKDGTFDDNTGNAWDIAYSGSDGGYYYNTGIFRNGHAVKKSNKLINMQQIEKILAASEVNIDTELNWK